MAIVTNNGFHSPEIAAAAQNIANMFAPPSAQELAGYSTARKNNQQTDIVSQLRADPRYQGFDHQAILADLFDPTQSFTKVYTDDATTRRGQDISAQTSRANNFDTNRTTLISNMFDALGPDDIRPDLPEDIAASMALPALPQVAGWRAGEAQRLIGKGSNGGITDEDLKSIVMNGSSASAAQERIARLAQNLISTGTTTDPKIANDVAIGIVDGRLRESRHPVTGEVVIIDMATGKPANLAANPASDPYAVSPTGDPIMDALNLPSSSFGPQYPAAKESFGVGGALTGAINRVSDAVGLGTPYPDVQQSQAAFGVLRENLMNDIASTYGRQPPSWLLKEIRDLTPDAGSPFEGGGAAQAKLTAIGRQLESEINLTRQALGRENSPTNRQELETRLGGLQTGVARIREVLAAFGQQPGQSAPAATDVPEGIDPADWQYMTEDQKALFR